MRPFLFSLNIFFSVLCFAQELNFEKGFLPDASLSNEIIRTSDSAVYIAHSSESGIYDVDVLVTKLDLNGNQIWQIQSANNSYYNCQPVALEINTDGSFYLLTYNMLMCYALSDFRWVLQKFDSNGNPLWIREWDSFSWGPSQLQGLTIHHDATVGLNYWDSNGFSGILRLGNLGQTLDSISDQSPITYTNGYLTNGNFIANDAQTLYLFDAQGNFLNAQNLTGDIQEMVVFNDSIYILTLDQIYLFGANLNLISNSTITGYSGLTRLKVNTQQVNCLAENTNNIYVLSFPHNLSNLQSQTISCNHTLESAMDFRQNGHLTLSERKNLYNDYALRVRDFSLNSNNPLTVNHADAGLTDIIPTNVQVYAGPNSQYIVKIWGDVVLKNFGNTPIQECRILHAYGAPLNYSCGENYFDSLFTNLNVLPGASVTLNLGLIHDKTEYIPSQALNYNLCVYTAIPNGLVDLNPNNDVICENLFLGYAGIDDVSDPSFEVFPNPSQGSFEVISDRKLGLITVYDLTGKEILKTETYQNSFKMDLSLAPKGCYQIKVTNEYGSFIKKVIIFE